MSNIISPIDIRSVHRICSGQVILDLAGVVKELVENSIDACATSIEIKFNELGQGGLEVVDNGVGIDPSGYESLALKHATSKLKSFEDLERVSTLGFRGEALSSLCSLSEVVVTTATQDQAPKGMRLVYDSMGHLVSKTSTARAAGTTVQISNIFHSLPVRKQEFKRNAKRDYAKALTMIQTYAIICKSVRVISMNQPAKGQITRAISTNGNKSLRDNIANVFGAKSISQIMPFSIDLSPVIKIEEDQECIRPCVEGFVSIPQWGYGRSSSDRQYFYINGRPCSLQKIAKAFTEVYRSFISNQYPFVVANIVVPTDIYDVNVSPDKRTIFLHKEQSIADHIIDDLAKQLEPHRSTYKINETSSAQITEEEVEENPCSPVGVQQLNIHDADDMVDVDDDDGDEEQYEEEEEENDTNEGHGQISMKETALRTAPTQSRTLQYPLPTNGSPLGQAYESKKRTSNTMLDFISKRPRESKTRVGEGLACAKTVEEMRNETDEDHDIIPSSNDEIQIDTGALQDSDNDMDDDVYNNKERPRVISKEETLPSRQLWNTKNEDISTNVDVRRLLDCLSDQEPGEFNERESKTQEHADLKCASISNTDNNDIAADTLNRVIKKSDFSRMQILGQFNLGFIIVELDDSDLYIIDQHAADEKYNFETLQKTTRIEGQQLIRPHNPCLSAPEELVAMDNADILNANGFKIEIQPDNEPTTRIKVISQPVSKNTMFDSKDFGELVSLLSERPGEMVRCSRTRAMFASRACRKSFMIGDTLTKRQMTTVVQHMGDIDQPWNCPHGRPTMRHLLCLSPKSHPKSSLRNIDCFGSLFKLDK